MQRKIIDKLIKWKNQTENKLPLLIYGARQVGKTYTLTEFASQNYSNMIYVNFEVNPAMKSIFDGEISPERIISLEIFQIFKAKI